MSALLPDESYCKSELGLILYKDRKIYGFHSEVVNVKEPTSVLFGHVDYDIQITATPHNSIDHEPRHFLLTSRFKDLNRLYIQLSTIHKQLYLKDTFPTFVEAKFFGSSSPETISERRRAIETFLNFVLKSDVLCKARSFQTFIEVSKAKTEKESTVPETSESAIITAEGPVEDNKQQTSKNEPVD
ncbi:PX domain-containing protein [Ditylenchus destructor]|uniref:PX domain-containing protein n=1 Tax=Ditylenchus destructor TaxID=166010 RepID=A0AAD4N8Z4_9BILA|nr:PX domain-containing protein [Ditylenchus destructor]